MYCSFDHLQMKALYFFINYDIIHKIMVRWPLVKPFLQPFNRVRRPPAGDDGKAFKQMCIMLTFLI